MADDGRRRRDIEAALSAGEDRFFVGREAECRVFAEGLAGGRREWLILNVHGPGGVGKSTLLDAFRRLARRHGAFCLACDAGALPRAVDAVAARLREDLRLVHREAARRPVVVLLDSYEEMAALDRWLRAEFLAHLPEEAVVVIAGRHPLQELWRDAPAWRQLVRPLPLAPFDLELTRRYLALHGMQDEASVRAVWESAHGLPLAISLAAALAGEEGPEVLAEAAGRPEVVAELARRWLREVPDDRLRSLVEASAVLRRVHRDILARMTGRAVTPGDFDRLTSLSFVRLEGGGWTVHSMVRSALVRDMCLKSPGTLHAYRRRAMEYLAEALTRPGPDGEWGATLTDFFFLLGDSLIGAAFFPNETGADDRGLHVVPATAADLPDLEAYFAACRRRALSEGQVSFQMIDPATGVRFTFPYLWVDFVRAPLDFRAFLELAPGAVRLARDALGRLCGVSVVIPVNAETLPFLQAQPVTRAYFRALSPEELSDYDVPAGRTSAWFIRHLHTVDLQDSGARGVLFRDLFSLAFRNGRLITSSPAPFFQDLVRRCGFVAVPGATHDDFGADLPSPTFVLDVRGPRLAGLLLHLIHGGKPPDDPRAGAMASTLAERLAAWAAASGDFGPGGGVVGRPAAPGDSGDGKTGREASGTMARLTGREREVALAVMDGLSNAEIGARLGISLLTVKKHLTRIFEKAGVQSRTQLIRRLLAEGVR